MWLQTAVLVALTLAFPCLAQRTSRGPISRWIPFPDIYGNSTPVAADQVLRVHWPPDTNGRPLKKDPTYFIVASRVIRPGQTYRVAIHLLEVPLPVFVRASILRYGTEVTFANKTCHAYVAEIFDLELPKNLLPGVYKLRIEGNVRGVLGGTVFVNETSLEFSQRSMTIFIHTDRPFYKQGQTVYFRALPIATDLKPFSEPIDVFMVDPSGYIVKRWMSRQTAIGIISLSYELPDQVMIGTWTIRISAQGQMEERQFLVEEYYQTRFEVDVSIPPFVVHSEDYLIGTVNANYTSGAPVNAGNLTLRVSVHPPRTIYSETKFDPSFERFVPYFDGSHTFEIAMWDLERLASKLDRMQVTVTASVGDHFYDKVIDGYSSTIIVTNDIQFKFLGSQPQVFNPAAPLKVYLAVSHPDNSPLPSYRLYRHKVELHSTVVFRNGLSQKLEPRSLKMMGSKPGIWEVDVDLMSEPFLSRNRQKLHTVKALKLEAKYKDGYSDPVYAELLLLTQFAPNNHHLSVSTSTRTPRIGEYIIFHVRADFYLQEFSYLIVGKGVILSGGVESITSSIRTFAVSLLPAMAPTSTIVVYYISLDGDIVADSLTFPVHGVQQNAFNITLIGRRDKLGETVGIKIFGTAGTYIGLSALDQDLYSMQARNELNMAEVLNQMNGFDSGSNGTLFHTWTSRTGLQNRHVHFPAHNYAPDANRTFEYAGLLVFTDANITSRTERCNQSNGLRHCLSGGCYLSAQHCDGQKDCDDGSDETSCVPQEDINMKTWQIYRRNHIQRLYSNLWLWKDVQIGRKGFVTLNVTVPERSSHWIVTGFSLNKAKGLGVLDTPVQISSERPFYMHLEMPTKCFLGEQLGLRVTVFNNQPIEIRAAVILGSSTNYQVLEVDSNEIPLPSRRRSASGHHTNEEHQHIVLIPPHGSAVVYMPITVNTLGNINVTVMAQAEIGKVTVNRLLTVEADGVTQFRHTSVLLDLSNRAYLIKYFDVNLTDIPMIPYRKERYYVYSSNRAYLTVFGNVVGPLYPSLSVNTSIVLNKPDACGEQNMFNFAINLYMLNYMRLTNQRTLAIEKKMFHYMNKIYAHQLSYQTPDGAFKVFRWNKQPSVWLTAFCARIFHEANNKDWENFLHIDELVISRAVTWLLRHQTRYGAFFETSEHPYDRKMNCTSESPEDPTKLRNISLTAHVLLTLVSVREVDGEVGEMAFKSSNLAVNYLERMLKVITEFRDPYELAIVTYALIRAGSSDMDDAFDLLNSKSRDIDGMVYWGPEVIPPPKYNIASNKPYLQARLPYQHDASNIEATAYALLAFVERQALLQEPIVEWLNFQRLTDGGWASTQDTMIAYKALLEYSSRLAPPEKTDISITVDATSTSPGFEKIFNINDNNLGQLQSVQIPNAWGTIRMLIKGRGMAVAQLSVQYNVDSTEFQTHPPIDAFSLEVTTSLSGRNFSHLSITSCQRWTLLNESDVSGMAVLEITLPTGYFIQQQELDSYVKSKQVSKLQQAQFAKQQTVFYFDNLDTENTCIEVTAERWYPVANVSRFFSAKVYDYYAPERFNSTIFEIDELHSINICEVCGSYQCPHCFVLSSTSEGHVQPSNLVIFMCFLFVSTIAIAVT